MLQVNGVAPFSNRRPAVVIDLVGDLDSTLAAILAETLAGVDDPEVLISCKHVCYADATGISAVTRALDDARRRGCDVVISAASRKLRASFAAAQIACAPSGAGEPAARLRSVIIAHNSATGSKAAPRHLPQTA